MHIGLKNGAGLSPLILQGAELTPWGRVLLQKLKSAMLVKKYLVFYGTNRLITALTNVSEMVNMNSN
jgi:hypothetical protein